MHKRNAIAKPENVQVRELKNDKTWEFWKWNVTWTQCWPFVATFEASYTERNVCWAHNGVQSRRLTVDTRRSRMNQCLGESMVASVCPCFETKPSGRVTGRRSELLRAQGGTPLCARRETAKNNRDSRRGARRFRVDILFATAGDTCNAHYTSRTSCSTNLPVAFPSYRVLFALHEDPLASGRCVSPLVLYGGVNWTWGFSKNLVVGHYKLMWFVLGVDCKGFFATLLQAINPLGINVALRQYFIRNLFQSIYIIQLRFSTLRLCERQFQEFV